MCADITLLFCFLLPFLTSPPAFFGISSVLLWISGTSLLWQPVSRTRCFFLLRVISTSLTNRTPYKYQVSLVLLVLPAQAISHLSAYLTQSSSKPLDSALVSSTQQLICLKYHLHTSKQKGRRNIFQMQRTREINRRPNREKILRVRKNGKRRMLEIAAASEITQGHFLLLKVHFQSQMGLFSLNRFPNSKP